MRPSPVTVFMTRMRPKIHAPGLAVVAVLAALLAGCATAPPPVQLLARAQSEIRAARAAGAASSDPGSLAEAERRLAAAQAFSASQHFDKATAAAEEAEAAAATARARAQLAQLDEQIREKTGLNRELQADLERRQAAAAAAQQAAVAPSPAAAGSAGAPATASSSGASGPVTLPPIQLGQPPVPASSAAVPATPSSSGGEP